MNIPKRLQNPNFRFVPVHSGSKRPVGCNWQSSNNYRYYDVEIKKSQSYGVVGGFGGLYVVDFDSKEIQDKLLSKLPETFAVKSGGKGLLHLYYTSKNPPTSFKILDSNNNTLADIQGIGKMAISAGSKHAETGKEYLVEKDVPIAEFDISKLREILKEYNIVQSGSSEKGGVVTGLITCPFHTDSNPSCAIYQEDGTFFCFSCKAYGLLEAIQHMKQHGKCKSKQTKNGTFYFIETGDFNRYMQIRGKEQKETISKRVPEILKDEDLLDIIVNEVNKKVVHEKETIKGILICCFGSLVKNNNIASYNLIVNSESGAGKDFICDNAVKILPTDKVVKRTRISPKVWTYWNRSKMQDNSFTWDGLIFYGEDLNNAVLNDECMKTMCSSGTHATVVINQQAVDIEIRGKPVMIITSASASLEPEMLRRFTIINLDESHKQTKRIIRKKALNAAKGKGEDYNPEITKVLKHLKRYEVSVPFAEKFVEFFPTDSIIMRTHFDRFIDYIKASAVLHQYQREKEKGKIVANGQDYNIARDVLIKTTSNQYMIPLTKDQKKILEAIKSLNIKRDNLLELIQANGGLDVTGFYSISEIATKISFLDYKTLRSRLDSLVEARCLIKDSIKWDFKPATSYKLLDVHKITIPEWKMLQNTNSENITNTENTENTTNTGNTENTKSNWSNLSNCIGNFGTYYENYLEIIRERGKEGYEVNIFAEKYGEEIVTKLKERGLIMENPKGILRVAE